MTKVCWCKNGEIAMTMEKKDGMHIVHNGRTNLIISEKLANKIKTLNYLTAIDEIEKEGNSNER